MDQKTVATPRRALRHWPKTLLAGAQAHAILVAAAVMVLISTAYSLMPPK